MHLKRTIALTALSLGLVSAAPAVAQPGDHHRGDRARDGGGDVPSRVGNRVKRAERALDRATDRADDGDSTGAASALGAVRKNLAAATKRANRRVVAAADNGPAAAGAVTRADHRAVDGTVDLSAGSSAELEDSLDQTLNAAIDGRDSTIAAVAGLPAEDQEEYGHVLDRIESDVSDEIEAIDETLVDDADELSDEAEADLAAARTKLVATQSTVEGLNAGLEGAAAESDEPASGDEDCERGGRRRGDDA